MTEIVPYGVRLTEQIARYGSLCVGIDPHASLLDEWGFSRSAEGLAAFGHRVVAAAVDAGAAAVKPQVAFFEAYGSAGFLALEGILTEAKGAGLLVIADAKRGDIGSSNAGYAQAWLDAGSPFVCDALTVSPYLGVGAVAELARVAIRNGRGLYLLAATSNPEAVDIQNARVAALGDGGDPRTVAASVLAAAAAWNADEVGDGSAVGSVGVVLGATLDLATRGIDARRLPLSVPILAPGFGAQGASLSSADRRFPGASSRLLANVSRSVLAGRPDELEDRIRAAKVQLSCD